MELFGRDGELAELVARLGSNRLVTVTGPGGIGKTVLAQRAVERSAGQFARGAHRVDLTRIDSPDAVGGAIAAQLGFDSFRSLLDSPTDQSALVLLDNCEHVVDAAAAAVAELLEACRAPTVMTTSRVALDLPGESLVVLGPLGEGAVPLLVERARDAGAPIRDVDLVTAEAICRAVDRVPLAIELAAARLRTLSPSEVLDRLDDPDVLSRPRFRGAARHGSLRATLRWSYDLLEAQQQVAFDRLGVFSGPFTASLAHAVIGEPGTTAAQTGASIDELVAASLLSTEQEAATTTYRMLLNLRSLAREHLIGRDELERLQRRLTDVTLGTSRSIEDRTDERWDADALLALLGKFEHLVGSLRWAISVGDRDRAQALLGVLWGTALQAHAAEIGHLGEEVLDRWPGGELRSAALATVVTCRFLAGDPHGAIDLAATSPAPAGRAGARLLRAVGLARAATGDEPGSVTALLDGAGLARDPGVAPLERELRVYAAQLGAASTGVAAAVATLRGIQEEAAAEGSVVDLLLAGLAEADVEVEEDPDSALVCAEQTLALAADVGLDWIVDLAGGIRGLALCGQGRSAAAAATLQELVASLWLRGAMGGLRPALHAAASVLHTAGHSAAHDVAAAADGLPVVTSFARQGRERFGFDHANGLVPRLPEAVELAGRALTEVARGSDATARTSPGLERTSGRFVRDGDGWTLDFAGRTARLRDSKGMGDLARLLAEPGQEVHCVDLFGAVVAEDSAGEVMDGRARAAYEQRLRDLQDDITEAEAHQDLVRAERAQTEFDQVLDHLTSALGLAGRTRRTAGVSERSRSAVTQRIRGTIRRVGEVHPELGEHLRVSVQTGTWCCYGPERPVRWTVRVAGARAGQG